MAILKDIYRGYKFTVTISGNNILTRTAFQKVSGLKTSVEVVDYREGNMPDRVQKIPGMMSYDTVTLERGLSNDSDFKNWVEKVCKVSDGGSTTMPAGGSADYARQVTITLYNKQGQAVKEYKLLDAFPSEYTIGDFDASSNDVVISTIVLQHHGIIETHKANS